MSAISPNALQGPNISDSPLTEGGRPLSDLPFDRVSAIECHRLSHKRWLQQLLDDFKKGVARRWQRERRRRKIGRAYDMALEIAPLVPSGSHLLDVGCGNGFIAHHLGALLGSSVTGIDLPGTTEAQIDYRQFDGTAFPIKNHTVDAILFCYVLHHAQELRTLLAEVRRTLRDGGLVIVYEDIPRGQWDRIICGIHNLKWRSRTGPCTFRGERGWYETFASEGFELCQTRPLSRWRNLAHPVSRRFFLFRAASNKRGNDFDLKS